MEIETQKTVKIKPLGFRLKKMTKTDCIYTLFLFVVQILLYAGLSFTAKWLIQFDLFAPPEFLWGLFHIFWKWNLIVLIPSCLVFSYVICKRKNTTIGIISHMAFNSIPLIGLIIGIIG
ncbi:MAG: hypothetical protein NTV01_10765 [Bacteroidia bacterium]|nr:hypothetical protein [Bacteroidia bacterium]